MDLKNQNLNIFIIQEKSVGEHVWWSSCRRQDRIGQRRHGRCQRLYHPRWRRHEYKLTSDVNVGVLKEVGRPHLKLK